MKVAPFVVGTVMLVFMLSAVALPAGFPETPAGVAMRMFIKEMLFEYAMEYPLPAIGEPKPGEQKVFFVDYGDGRDHLFRDGQDPPQYLIERLSRPGWTAKPVSRVGFGEYDSIIDPDTGDYSCVVRVRIVRLHRDGAEVEVEAFHGSEAMWQDLGEVRWLSRERLEREGRPMGTLLREGPGGGVWVFDVRTHTVS